LETLWTWRSSNAQGSSKVEEGDLRHLYRPLPSHHLVTLFLSRAIFAEK
jgi:hypothetical protein